MCACVAVVCGRRRGCCTLPTYGQDRRYCQPVALLGPDTCCRRACPEQRREKVEAPCTHRLAPLHQLQRQVPMLGPAGSSSRRINFRPLVETAESESAGGALLV